MINCLNWLGFCESYQSVSNLRNWLAAMDEVAVKKQAGWGVCHIIFDNLDLYINTLHHLTLPVLMFELYPTFHLSNTDEKSLHDALQLFDRDILDMNSIQNQNEKEHFLIVVKTVLAHTICTDIEGLKWVSKHYEYHHPHKHSQTAASRSALHVDPPKALDEKKLTDMTKLMQQFVERYLDLMAEHISKESKEKFLDCIRKVKNYSCSETELRQCETFLLETAKEYGFLIIHGDLLRLFHFFE